MFIFTDGERTFFVCLYSLMERGQSMFIFTKRETTFHVYIH